MKKRITYIVIGGVLVLLIILGVKFWLGNTQYRFGTDRAAVIAQVESLSRLETASFTIDKVIEASTNYGALKQYFFGDKLVLIAHGKVTAGVDMSVLKPEDFKGAGTTLTITLPPAQILSTNLDNAQTRVFDRSQGLFTKGDLNLEAEARQQAESAIRQAACDGGILTEATANAQKQLEVIFKAAGFQSVTITVPSGTVCK